MAKLTPVEAFMLAAQKSKNYTGTFETVDVPKLVSFETGTKDNTLLCGAGHYGYVSTSERFSINTIHEIEDIEVYAREQLLYGVCAKYAGEPDMVLKPSEIVALTIDSFSVRIPNGYPDPVYFYVGNDDVCYSGLYFTRTVANYHELPLVSFDVEEDAYGKTFTLREPVTIPSSDFAPTMMEEDSSEWDYKHYFGIGAYFVNDDERISIFIESADIEMSVNAGVEENVEMSGTIDSYGSYIGLTPETVTETIEAIGEYVEEKLTL